jgi:hypothetical protein
MLALLPRLNPKQLIYLLNKISMKINSKNLFSTLKQ